MPKITLTVGRNRNSVDTILSWLNPKIFQVYFSNSQLPGSEVGIYKRKHAFDQESDQEKKKENTLSNKKAIKQATKKKKPTYSFTFHVKPIIRYLHRVNAYLPRFLFDVFFVNVMKVVLRYLVVVGHT